MHTTELAQLVDLDARAVHATVDIASRFTPEAADRPTPCTGWMLSDLLAHMTAQHHGFARAARGEQTTLTDWQPVTVEQPAVAYRESCTDVLDAFAGLVDPQAPVVLPLLRSEPFPALAIVGFHLVDYAVHAWDAARSFELDTVLDDDTIAAALRVARAVPEDGRDQPGASFAPRLPLTDGASPFDQILLLLGRDPEWRPS